MMMTRMCQKLNIGAQSDEICINTHATCPKSTKIQTDMGELPGAISKTTNFWQTFNHRVWEPILSLEILEKYMRNMLNYVNILLPEVLRSHSK
jgi:hypothetical protein